MLPIDYITFKKHFNTPFSVTDSISEMKISKDKKKLISINSQLDWINIYREFYKIATE